MNRSIHQSGKARPEWRVVERSLARVPAGNYKCVEVRLVYVIYRPVEAPHLGAGCRTARDLRHVEQNELDSRSWRGCLKQVAELPLSSGERRVRHVVDQTHAKDARQGASALLIFPECCHQGFHNLSEAILVPPAALHGSCKGEG